MAQEQGLTGIANRYAAALLPLVETSGQSAEIEAQLRLLVDWAEQNDAFRNMLRNPSFRRSEQESALTAILDTAKAHKLVQGFVHALCRNRRLFLLPRSITRYFALRAQAEGALVVDVQAASPLTDAQTKSLSTILTQAYGKNPQLRITVVPQLLGGFVLRIGSKMIDVSLKHKLAQLQIQMKEAV